MTKSVVTSKQANRGHLCITLTLWHPGGFGDFRKNA